jgi:hypothetical protein
MHTETWLDLAVHEMRDPSICQQSVLAFAPHHICQQAAKHTQCVAAA